jgi:uncharacterized protein (DUF58 family)
LPLPDAAPVFDSAFLAKLEQLYLLSKKIFRGEHRAERRSRQTGSSLEFADYRNYTRGDDLRSIDWNAYGRLDRLFVKLFEEEQDLHIYLLVDASASMWWRPEARRAETPKLQQAIRIAASLAYIGLVNLDRVNIQWFGRGLNGDLGLTRGKSQFHKVLRFLSQPPQLAGETSLLETCRAFTRLAPRRGLVFVLSDLFDPAGYEEALSLLRFAHFDVHLLQVLEPRELEPTESGDLRLQEDEHGRTMDLTADEGLLQRYRAEVRGFVDGLAGFCRERGMSHIVTPTDVPFEELVLKVLRDGLLLR